MDYISGNDRTQVQFFSLEDMVSPDSWARMIDLFVDILPLKELGFKHADIKKEGRPPYDPAALLKLYLYGYKHAIRSSRKLEHACKVNVELWWLLKGLKPSFRSIAYFRKENASAFKAAFRRFVTILQELELIDGDTIAIDSFKIRAQNSLANNFSQKKIDRQVEYIDHKIEEYEQQLESADTAEQEALQTKIDTKKKRKEYYQAIEKQLAASDDNQISVTDQDAKSVAIHGNSYAPGYCIQAATDSKNKLFILSDIHGPTDQKSLAPMAIEAKSLLGVATLNTLTDGGYYLAEQLNSCQAASIVTYCSPYVRYVGKNGHFPITAFVYDPAQDVYTCPAGKKLSPSGNLIRRHTYYSRTYSAGTKACRECSLRNACTTKKSGRAIERIEFQDIIDANNQRIAARPEYYRTRQQIIEHQFGTLKRQLGFTFTLMKGKSNVLAEVNMLMIIYNLQRSITILGFDNLKRKLKGFCIAFCALLSEFRELLLSPFYRQITYQ